MKRESEAAGDVMEIKFQSDGHNADVIVMMKLTQHVTGNDKKIDLLAVLLGLVTIFHMLV